MPQTRTDSRDPDGGDPDPDPVTREQILDVFTDDQPRPTDLIAEEIGADVETVEAALDDLKRQGSFNVHERSVATKPTRGSRLWYPESRIGGRNRR